MANEGFVDVEGLVWLPVYCLCSADYWTRRFPCQWAQVLEIVAPEKTASYVLERGQLCSLWAGR